MYLYAIAVLTFLTVFTLILGIYGITQNSKMMITQRLNRIGMEKSQSIEEETLARPFYTRVIKPIIDNISSFLIKVTPTEIINSFENKIVSAGTPFNFGVSEWISLQVFAVVIIPLLTGVIAFTFHSPFKTSVYILAFEILLSAFGPHLLLSSKTQERQKEIFKTLPDILDLLTVSVEAGLGFDAALGKVVEKIPGVLAKEFDKVLQEIKMGKPRKDALRDISSRVGIIDFTTFIASIIQADQLGVSIGNVLRIQSHQMRLRRRQNAQERAMKAPVKMLLPMVFFIFPTIFTVILGPVVISIMNTLMK